MSKFTDKRDAFESWISHGFHELFNIVAPEAQKVSEAVVGDVLEAGVKSLAAGNNRQETVNAIRGAAENSLKTVGVTVGMETVNSLVSLAAAHVSTAPTAPLPPAA